MQSKPDAIAASGLLFAENRTAFHKGVSAQGNVFDLSCVVLTLLLSLLASGSIVGVGLGTLLAMLGTGRTVALFNSLAERRLVSGLEIRA